MIIFLVRNTKIKLKRRVVEGTSHFPYILVIAIFIFVLIMNKTCKILYFIKMMKIKQFKFMRCRYETMLMKKFIHV